MKGVSGSSFEEKVFLKVNVKATELPINKHGCKMQHLTYMLHFHTSVAETQVNARSRPLKTRKTNNPTVCEVLETKPNIQRFTDSLPIIYVIKPIA